MVPHREWGLIPKADGGGGGAQNHVGTKLTVNSSLSAPGMDSKEVEACIQRMDDLDAKVVSHIYHHCNNLMEFKAIQSDKRSRYSRAQLQSKESKRVASSF